MSKKKAATRSLALRIGHTTPFRRTVTVDGEKYQLVFEPGKDYEITEAEIAGGLQKLIDGGLLVDPNRDHKGRQRRPTVAAADATATIDKLEKRIEQVAAENAALKAAAPNDE